MVRRVLLYVDHLIQKCAHKSQECGVDVFDALNHSASLSAPDRMIEVASAIVIAETQIAIGCFVLKGGFAEHRFAQPSVPATTNVECDCLGDWRWKAQVATHRL